MKDLRTLLDRCGVRSPVVLVSHSYGGFISLLTAQDDRRIKGLVLVDANVPGYFTRERLDALLLQYRPLYPRLREEAPQLAPVMIAMMEAYPASAAAVEKISLPAGLALIDIVAERSWAESPADAEAMRAAHAAFVKADTARTSVFAAGSSHDVIRDRPELIIEAIDALMQRALR